MFAFQPLEALLQFLPVALIVIYLPLHPLALLAYLSYDTVINVAGHSGYEIIPDRLATAHFSAASIPSVTTMPITAIRASTSAVSSMSGTDGWARSWTPG